MIRRFFLVFIVMLFSNECYSQFDWKQERKIKMSDDSIRQTRPNFIAHIRTHYGLLIGYHHGNSPEIEMGFHKTIRAKNGNVGFAISYLRNMTTNVNSLSISSWGSIGLIGIGLLAKTNTQEFKSFSYSLQPLVGIEYIYGGLFYGYNYNIDSYKTPILNTHTLTLRLHLAFITKKGKPIFKPPYI